MYNQRRRMSIRRLQSAEEPQNVVRRNGRLRRRNGLANVLASLSGEEIQTLRAQVEANQADSVQRPHPARRGSTGTIPLTTEQRQGLQRRRSLAGEPLQLMNGSLDGNLEGTDGQESLLEVPSAGLLRLSPSSSLRMLEEEHSQRGGQNGGEQALQVGTIPSSNYLRRRRNAVSYVNSTQFFLETLVGQAGKP